MNSGLVVYDQSIDCCLASFFRLPRFSLLFARSAAAHDTCMPHCLSDCGCHVLAGRAICGCLVLS
jgi:hypothetical protein